MEHSETAGIILLVLTILITVDSMVIIHAIHGAKDEILAAMKEQEDE